MVPTRHECMQCGQEIPALQFDRVLFCPSCNLAVEAGEDGHVRCSPVFFARACCPPSGDLVHLPIWRFELAHQARLPAGRDLPWRWVFVPAFSMSAVGAESDIGIFYTQRQVQASEGSPAHLLLGGRRSSFDAEVLIPLVILTLVEREGVGNPDLDYEIKSRDLMATPFFVRPSHVTDGLLGRTVESTFVTDLPEIQRQLDETVSQ